MPPEIERTHPLSNAPVGYGGRSSSNTCNGRHLSTDWKTNARQPPGTDVSAGGERPVHLGEFYGNAIERRNRGQAP